MARTKDQREAEEAAKAAAEHASASYIGFLAGVSQTAVGDATASSTCPRNPDGSFSWSAVREWASREGRWFARASGTTADAAMLAKFKALSAQREHEAAMGKLIPREEAIAAQIRLALEFKAALLAMPHQMANALANLPAREIETQLRERVSDVLDLTQTGRIPIAPAVAQRIATFVAEVLAVEGAG